MNDRIPQIVFGRHSLGNGNGGVEEDYDNDDFQPDNSADMKIETGLDDENYEQDKFEVVDSGRKGSTHRKSSKRQSAKLPASIVDENKSPAAEEYYPTS